MRGYRRFKLLWPCAPNINFFLPHTQKKPPRRADSSHGYQYKAKSIQKIQIPSVSTIVLLAFAPAADKMSNLYNSILRKIL